MTWWTVDRFLVRHLGFNQMAHVYVWCASPLACVTQHRNSATRHVHVVLVVAVYGEKLLTYSLMVITT